MQERDHETERGRRHEGRTQKPERQKAGGERAYAGAACIAFSLPLGWTKQTTIFAQRAEAESSCEAILPPALPV